MILALPPGGKGRRTFQCFDCDRPDPLRSEGTKGWLQGELHHRSKAVLFRPLRDLFVFPQLAFGLQPELHIPADGTAVLLP